MTVVAGHTLVEAGTRFLPPVLGVSAAVLVGSLVRLRLRHRKAAPPPSTPSTS
jgi:hypothetical protein